MNAKIIAGIIILILMSVGIYFAIKPISNPSESVETTHSSEDPHTEASGENKEVKTADDDFLEFQNWQKTTSSSPKELDDYLVKLSEEYLNDYRFSLERIRGAAKVKGVHSHKKEFELLDAAAQKAIECVCGDSKKMLHDLEEHKSNKERGFWKLSTHPKQWNLIIEALEHEH